MQQGSSMHGSHVGAHAQPASPKPSASRTLNRDYKHARGYTGASAAQVPPWVGFLAGLAVGLAVAAAVWMHYRDQPPAEPQPTANASPASSKAPEDPHTEPSTAARADAQTATDPARDLTFYDFLPEQEVDVPRAVTPSTAAPPEVRILQAGAFKSTEQAEKLQAQLQLHGIESKIQRYMIDDETWYRVRIGPITSAAEQERIEEKLIEAEVDAQPVVADADVPPP